MSFFYKIVDGVGLTPWERMQTLAAGKQATEMLEREEQEAPPFGTALDLGCGSGVWSVYLAARGWQVTGVEIVPRAVRAARRRADQVGVDARFVEGDTTAGSPLSARKMRSRVAVGNGPSVVPGCLVDAVLAEVSSRACRSSPSPPSSVPLGWVGRRPERDGHARAAPGAALDREGCAAELGALAHPEQS